MCDTVPQTIMLAQASDEENKPKKERKKKKKKPAKNPAAVKLGHDRARSLTAKRRSEIASIAAKARWAKKEDEGPEQPPPEKP